MLYAYLYVYSADSKTNRRDTETFQKATLCRTSGNSFIHSVFSLTTGPKPLPKRFLHIACAGLQSHRRP
jgi:hypothetical protein